MKPHMFGFAVAALSYVGWPALLCAVVFDSAAGLPLARSPLRATFAPLDTFAATYGTYSPWSPAEPRLAYRTKAGLFVFDAAAPKSKPLHAFRGPVVDYTWSPDGGWLLVVTVRSLEKGRVTSLVAVPVAEGAAATEVEQSDIVNMVWATDGNIYYWGWGTPYPHQLPPPAAWRANHAGPFQGRPVLIFAWDETQNRENPYYFHAALPRKIQLLSSLGSEVLRRDGFPDGRLLVYAYGAAVGGAGKTLILDARGTPISQVGGSAGRERFAGTSVSADGSFVAGDRTTDDGHAILSAKLVIIAVSNAWRVDVDGVDFGMNPQLSRTGTFMAYTDEDDRVHVGSLVFRY